jgi:plasmid stabilization system protein ParE
MPTLRKALRVERDLEVIWDYIAADNPEAAERCLRQIDAQFDKLARSPFIGRERNTPPIIRRRQLCDLRVEIVRVIEGHRDITSEMFE